MEQRRNDRHRANLIMKKLLLLLLACSTITGWAASSTFSNVTVTGTSNLNQIYVSGTVLGSLATQNGTFSGITSGTNTGDQTVSSIGAIPGFFTGTNNTFIFEGDSITAGSALSVGQDIATQVSLLPDFSGKGTFRNVAIGATGFLSVFNAGVFTGTLTTSGTTVSISNSAPIKFGFIVTGSGIPASTYVMSVPTGTTFTISNAATITGTSALTMTGTTIGGRYQALVYPHRPTANGGDGGTMSILSIEAGANDCQIAASGTAYLAVRDAYMAQAASDGFTIIDHTIMPHEGYFASTEAIRISANNGISTGTNSLALVDLAGLFPSFTNTTYFNVDGIHLTESATKNWASAIQSTLRGRSKFPQGRIPMPFYIPYYQFTGVSAANYQMGAQSQESLIAYTTTTGTGQRVELPISGRELAGKFVIISDFSGSASASNPINVAGFGFGAGGSDLVNGGTTQIPAVTTPYGSAFVVGNGLTKWSALTSGAYLNSGASYQAAAAGTAYTLTASYASVDFGTTDPSITLVTAGNYYIYVNISTAFNAATFAGVQSVSAKLRRTSGTPADIGTPRSQPLPIITALTGSGPSVMVGPLPYTATANDVVTVQAVLSATPGAGSVTVDACEITAIPR